LKQEERRAMPDQPLGSHLAQHTPNDPEALRLLAGGSAAPDAERLLRQAVVAGPGHILAHADLASLLCRLGRGDEAVAMLDEAMGRLPDQIWPLSLKIAALTADRRIEEALPGHEELVARAPRAAVPWLNYGYALKTLGRTDEAVAAYRQSLALDPASGFAWWGLANLRTVALGPSDIDQMERVLPGAGADLNRIQLHFALGRALGDVGEFERSFRHYEQANVLRGELAPYDARNVSDAAAAGRMFSAGLLARPPSNGCLAGDPIFIVGMPRSGSTLVEQILASHPMIEGPGELFELQTIVTSLGAADDCGPSWIETVAGIGQDGLRALGDEYLASTRKHRRTDRPHFIDKMPANWRYVGLIRLILPNARIIDVRRSMHACCFSNFATYFNRDTKVPTTLSELGAYYRAYVDLIDQAHAAIPGWIHHVQYEQVVADLETEVRRLLDYLALPFDEACLEFHRTARAIHTPSAQQVREPLNTDGLDRWRSYAPWLGPLDAAS
jgi:tetratricopeptide (TPR) repeat protein